MLSSTWSHACRVVAHTVKGARQAAALSTRCWRLHWVAQVPLPLPLLGLGFPNKQMSSLNLGFLPRLRDQAFQLASFLFPRGSICPQAGTGLALRGKPKQPIPLSLLPASEELALWLQAAGGHAGTMLLEQGGWWDGGPPELISRAPWPLTSWEPHSHAVQRLGLDVSLTWLEFVPLTSTHLYR